MLEQNAASFIAGAAATSSASIVDTLCQPLQSRLEANRGVRKEGNIRGHRLVVIRVFAPVYIRKCHQLETTYLARDDEIHRPG